MDDNVYTAEAIVAKRKRQGITEYRISWKGYPQSENTWEPDHNILDRALINDYESKNKSAKTKKLAMENKRRASKVRKPTKTAVEAISGKESPVINEQPKKQQPQIDQQQQQQQQQQRPASLSPAQAQNHQQKLQPDEHLKQKQPDQQQLPCQQPPDQPLQQPKQLQSPLQQPQQQKQPEQLPLQIPQSQPQPQVPKQQPSPQLQRQQPSPQIQKQQQSPQLQPLHNDLHRPASLSPAQQQQQKKPKLQLDQQQQHQQGSLPQPQPLPNLPPTPQEPQLQRREQQQQTSSANNRLLQHNPVDNNTSNLSKARRGDTRFAIMNTIVTDVTVNNQTITICESRVSTLPQRPGL